MYNKEINKTKKILKQYDCSFKQYMKDSGRRDDIDLGDIVVTKDDQRGIIVGWNRSSNYDVFFLDDETIYNIHPDDVELDNVQ